MIINNYDPIINYSLKPCFITTINYSLTVAYNHQAVKNHHFPPFQVATPFRTDRPITGHNCLRKPSSTIKRLRLPSQLQWLKASKWHGAKHGAMAWMAWRHGHHGDPHWFDSWIVGKSVKSPGILRKSWEISLLKAEISRCFDQVLIYQRVLMANHQFTLVNTIYW